MQGVWKYSASSGYAVIDQSESGILENRFLQI